EPASLQGHLPRASRLARSIDSPTEALVIAAGPNAYISPSWFSDRTQAPTWNFVSAQFRVEIESSDDPRILADHLDELVGIMERNRENPWSVAEMGGRREELARRIIAFDAAIGSWDGRFKLGQDEPAQTFAEITTALRTAGEHPVLSWMEAFDQR
ncbi:MAG: FMN-binding negative transcriptional regulator, partial [Proteobacteria bacterium]|nr:FMN-binding negative transcriptional regulator [Pseudomonadota bacterium]